MNKKNPVLTGRQEAFAVAYARLGIASHAYIEAYRTKKDASDATVRKEAYKLLADSRIQRRVRELHQSSRTAALVDHDRLVLMYLEAYDVAHENGDSAGMSKATTDLAKLTGFMVDKSLNLNANINGADSYEEVLKRIEARASRLGLKMPRLPVTLDATRN